MNDMSCAIHASKLSVKVVLHDAHPFLFPRMIKLATKIRLWEHKPDFVFSFVFEIKRSEIL